MFDEQYDPYDDDPPRRRFPYGCAIFVVVLLILVAFIGASLPDNFEFKISGPSIPWPWITPTSTPIPPHVVIREIREAAELVTVIVREDVRIQKYQDNGVCVLANIPPTEVLFIGDGEVRAGIDLDLITSDSVQISGGTVTVLLPSPFLLSHGFNESSSIMDIDEPQSMCDTSVESGLLNEVRREAEQSLLEAACGEGHILERANVNAEKALTPLIANLGFEEVIIKTQPTGNCP